jgi:hypothetical protein
MRRPRIRKSRRLQFRKNPINPQFRRFGTNDLQLYEVRRYCSCSPIKCRSGGTGRHAILRGWWGNPWGFESPLRHQPPPRFRTTPSATSYKPTYRRHTQSASFTSSSITFSKYLNYPRLHWHRVETRRCRTGTFRFECRMRATPTASAQGMLQISKETPAIRAYVFSSTS